MQETENDILKRVRKIEIKTRGLSNEIFAGKYHTAFRGRGMSFSEVREYRAGDDVRDIDWNVTARSRNRRRAGLLRRAEQRQGGLHLLFGPGRKVHPPEEGPQPYSDDHPRTDRLPPRIRGHETLGAGAFPDECQQEALHDLHPLGLHGLDRVYDPRETELPDVGIVELKDAESGRKVWVDTSSRAVRDHYAASWQRRSGEIEATLKHNRIDTAMISTDGDYVAELIKLFKQR